MPTAAATLHPASLLLALPRCMGYAEPPTGVLCRLPMAGRLQAKLDWSRFDLSRQNLAWSYPTLNEIGLVRLSKTNTVRGSNDGSWATPHALPRKKKH